MGRRIGIFGGTFNPIHRAHYDIALEFIDKFSLDLLYVIPNNVPPMKESHGVSGNERLEMLEIAFSRIFICADYCNKTAKQNLPIFHNCLATGHGKALFFLLFCTDTRAYIYIIYK
jgi:cytidyltransferase-like protein